MSDNILDTIRNKRHRNSVPPRDDGLLASSTQTPSTKDELQASLAKFPSTRRHSAIVLEEDIDTKLTRFCKESGITVEVFLEAAWVETTKDPILMLEILNEAKRRYKTRKDNDYHSQKIAFLNSTSHKL
jgi:hypothetical protein